MEREVIIKIYLCDFVEKGKTLASRHLVSSIGICREHDTRSININDLPQDISKTLQLRGEVEVFDKNTSMNLFNIELSGNQYLKLKIVEE
ncbi:MAG: hypothetical protein J7L82_06665 [Staphylothermus sp.]|nr:hypothetical protein [Staphylothermus sp.]